MAVDFNDFQIDSFFPLYKIEHGEEEWHYTGADHTIVFNGDTYIPAPIKHGEFQKESELSNFSLEITMPISELAQKFIAIAPPKKIFVTIYLYQESEVPQSFMAYQGEVTNITVGQNSSCTVSLQEYTIMAVKQPRLLIKPACNNVLFDTKCGLLKTEWKVEAVVDGFQGDGRYVESATFNLFPINYFRQGVMEFEGDFRHISFHNGVLCSLQIAFADLQVGDTVAIYPGCDKEPATCKAKFDNLDNYVGCPYVPRKNPVLYGL